MKVILKIFKWIGGLILLFLLYVIGSIAHGTATDFQPEEKIELSLDTQSPLDTIKDARLTFLNWNIGYGGLGAQSNFFYDDGRFFFSGEKMVRSPQNLVEKYVAGIVDFIDKNEADFILLQEVDQSSRRSYFINQYEAIHEELPSHNGSYAVNFNVSRVPIPVCEPWNVMGKMYSGLATFSRYEPEASIRYQFPGEYSWPDRIFHLDRCMSVERFATAHPDGKELVIINTHNSAYDGGKLKKQEMQYFKEFVLGEYQKGNYVIVGGDWNQTPPNIPFDKVAKDLGIATDSTYNPGNIAPDFMPAGWQWAYDSNVPTNRKLKNKLDYGETFVTLIDYYLVSPNVKVQQVAGKNLKFAYSDHNPVSLVVELQGMVQDTMVQDSVVIE